MRRASIVALLVGCGATGGNAPIDNTSRAPAGAFPCGLTSLAELDPFEPQQCEENGSCWGGATRSAVGSCTVAASSSFDIYRGRERSTVFEGDRPILSDNSPFTRRVVFDPRVPTPHGIRVGMTGADLERMAKPFVEIECTFDDSAWRGHLYCRLRKASHPECADPDANGALVVFDSNARRGDIAGAAGFDHVRRLRIVAVDLGPSCD